MNVLIQHKYECYSLRKIIQWNLFFDLCTPQIIYSVYFHLVNLRYRFQFHLFYGPFSLKKHEERKRNRSYNDLFSLSEKFFFLVLLQYVRLRFVLNLLINWPFGDCKIICNNSENCAEKQKKGRRNAHLSIWQSFVNENNTRKEKWVHKTKIFFDFNNTK